MRTSQRSCYLLYPKIRFSFEVETKDIKIYLLELAKQFEFGKNAMVLAMEDLKGHCIFTFFIVESGAGQRGNAVLSLMPFSIG